MSGVVPESGKPVIAYDLLRYRVKVTRHPHKVKLRCATPGTATICMKVYSYKNKKVTIVRELNLTDKHGTWVQIEFLDGEDKGFRIPATKESLK